MRKGFTLIELLVVTGISALLISIALIYNRIGQQQIALSVESAKIAQLILRAKELTIATYVGGAGTCGYGVAINYNLQTYSLFAYTPAGAPPCPKLSAISNIANGEMTMYNQASWQVAVSQGVNLLSSAPDAARVVLFYPPSPTTLMSWNGTNFLNPAQTSNIYLQTANGAGSAVISINPAGQVSF